MTQLSASFARDANRVPLTTDGAVTTSTLTLIGNNATVNAPIFHLTGDVEIRGLWGVVTTTLGANVTASFWRLNDQSVQRALTLNTGTTLSGIGVGSLLMKTTTVGTALTLLNASSTQLNESAANHMSLQPVIVTRKTAAVTDIEFSYATTDTPTSGAIQFFCRWLPMSADANITAAST